MTEHQQLPPDIEAIHELREYIEKLRLDGTIRVDKLPAAPLDFPGVDDTYNKFTWYEVVNTETGVRVGVFHTQKGVEL